MYAIRVDDQRKLLDVELSGRVSTDEALRAVSQAVVLAEASAIRAVTCDITKIERGPGSLLVVAAALKVSHRDGIRVALVASERQWRMATRFARFSGLRQAIAAFATRHEAEQWLAPVLRGEIARTLREEAEDLLGRPLIVPSSRPTTHQAPPAA